MSRSCATPVIFHYLDRLAGRAAQDKQLRTHSKSWDCSDVLHGVAARETHQGRRTVGHGARRAQGRGSRGACRLRHVRLSAAPTFRAGPVTASAILASARWPRGGRFFRRSRLRKISTSAPCCRVPAPTAPRIASACWRCFQGLPSARSSRRARSPAASSRCLRSGCLMGAPLLIMFDEPSLGLAPVIARDVLHTIRELNGEGITCLLVEQNVALSLKLASRAYVLENGRVTLSGSGSALLADDRVRSAYL